MYDFLIYYSNLTPEEIQSFGNSPNIMPPVNTGWGDSVQVTGESVIPTQAEPTQNPTENTGTSEPGGSGTSPE